MASCAVPECTNTKRNSKKSFFKLPKDKSIASLWVTRIRREDKLPIEVLVCEDHFSSECFDQSADLKRRLLPQGKNNSNILQVHVSMAALF